MNPNPQRNISAAESGVEPDQTLAAAAITGRPGRCCCFDQPRQRRSSKLEYCQGCVCEGGICRLRASRALDLASSIIVDTVSASAPKYAEWPRVAAFCRCALELFCLYTEPGAERGHADSSRLIRSPIRSDHFHTGSAELGWRKRVDRMAVRTWQVELTKELG